MDDIDELPWLDLSGSKDHLQLEEYGFGQHGKIDLFEANYVLSNRKRYAKISFSIPVIEEFSASNSSLMGSVSVSSHYNLFSYLRKKGYCSRFRSGKLYVMQKGRRRNESSYSYIICIIDNGTDFSSLSEIAEHARKLRKELILAVQEKDSFMLYSLKTTILD